MIAQTSNNTPIKAVALISGGLDSALAARVVSELGVDVYGIHFAMPWETGGDTPIQTLGKELGIPIVTEQLDDRYLELIKNPKHGYGSAFNPCVDCHIYMLKKAKEYMEKIHADFIVTGEVLGQRPMSQLKASLSLVERKSGLDGYLLRPLSAQLLEPTIPENEEKIDRDKLLNISGRSRKEQVAMAKRMKIRHYKAPAGGCLLTDKNFGKRIKDVLGHGYRDYRDTVSLQWGRHFRIDEKCRVIVGRDEKENDFLRAHARCRDMIFQLINDDGPNLILIGEAGTSDVLATAAGLVQWFSKYRAHDPVEVTYWPAGSEDRVQKVTAKKLSEEQIKAMWI